MKSRKITAIAVGAAAALLSTAGVVLLAVSGSRAVTLVLAAVVFSLSIVAGMLVLGPLAIPGLLLSVCIAVYPVGAAVMLMLMGFTAAMVNLFVWLRYDDEQPRMGQVQPC